MNSKAILLLGALVLRAMTDALAQPAVLQFASAHYAVSETGGVATVTVELTWGDPFDVYLVDYTTSNGTARAGFDFTATRGTLSFEWPETNKTFSISILNDRVWEGEETVLLTLDNPRDNTFEPGDATLGGTSNAVLTISAQSSPFNPFWTLRHPLPTSQDLWRIIYGNGVFVAVESDKPIVSPDGIHWVRHPEVEYNLSSLTYADGRFLALDLNRRDQLLSSEDGVNWSSQRLSTASSQFPPTLRSVTSGGGVVVVAGNAYDHNLNAYRALIFRSRNGTTWEEVDLGPIGGSDEWRGSAVGNNSFAVQMRQYGQDGIAWYRTNRIWTSADGSSWTSQVLATSEELGGISFVNGLFVACGWQTIVTSPDAINWSAQPLGEQTGYLCGAIYAAGKYVAVGGNTIATSSNGTDWVMQHLEDSVNLSGVAFGNGRYVAVGGCGAAFTSTDAVNWVKRSSGTCDLTFTAVACGPISSVAVGTAGEIFTAVNGGTWERQISETTLPLTSVAYGNGRFVALGCSPDGMTNGILTSADGTQWASQTASIPVRDVIFGGGVFVAAGAGILISADGVNWTTTSPATILSLAYGNGTFLAWHGSTSYTSSDGSNWVQHFSQPFPRNVIFGDGRFVASGPGGLLTSSNGADWVEHEVKLPAPPLLQLYWDHADLLPVAYGNGVLLGLWQFYQSTLRGRYKVGEFVLTSIDGTNWISSDPGLNSQSLIGFAYGNNRFVAVGERGAILESVNLGPKFAPAEPRRLPDGTTRLRVEWWRAEAPITLEASTDFETWTPVSTKTNVIGTVEFIDPEAMNHSRRFYRARGQ